tara:strand:- start:1254 stop:1409 length:156 start_codon:yes stop_codon:yes gene_type:complete
VLSARPSLTDMFLKEKSDCPFVNENKERIINILFKYKDLVMLNIAPYELLN